MSGAIWAIGESSPSGLTRLSTEVATLTRALADAAGREAAGVVLAADPRAAAVEMASYLPRVLAVPVEGAAASPWANAIAAELAALVARAEPSYLVIGAAPDGRDLAGMLSVRLGWGVLGGATAVDWVDGGPQVEMSILGGRAITASVFTADHGIVLLRPNAVTAATAPAPGVVEMAAPPPVGALARVTVVDRVSAPSSAVPIEEARIVVAGGRGVGGPDGFRVVAELAAALGGAVGATRAAVDAGWIDYAQQIGQTGKTVKPALYLALGVSGAIQHKVGMQTAETIVAVNRDPDAPIAEFADLLVVGDLFEVGPAITAALRARAD